MRLLCMCSMLGPKCVFSFAKAIRKMHFGTFPGSCHISESAKTLQELFGSALSHSFSYFALGDCSGGPQGAEMALWLCTFVGAH